MPLPALAPPLLAPAGLFLAITGTHLLAVASPGPDFALVLRTVVARGRAAGVAAGLGIGSGIVGHCALAFLGLGWLVARFPGLVTGLTVAGVALLAWIGVSALRAPDAPAEVAGGEPAPPPVRHGLGRAYASGLFTNLFNGKALLYFVGLGTTVLASHPPGWLVVALFAWLPLTTAAWFCALAWLLGHPRLQARLVRARPLLDKLMGAVLLLLAGALAAAAWPYTIHVPRVWP